MHRRSGTKQHLSAHRRSLLTPFVAFATVSLLACSATYLLPEAQVTQYFSTLAASVMGQGQSGRSSEPVSSRVQSLLFIVDFTQDLDQHARAGDMASSWQHQPSSNICR